jgi:hypothetical protein
VTQQPPRIRLFGRWTVFLLAQPPLLNRVARNAPQGGESTLGSDSLLLVSCRRFGRSRLIAFRDRVIRFLTIGDGRLLSRGEASAAR